MLAQIARFAYRRKWLVIIVMVGGLVVASGVSGGTGSDFSTEFNLPDSESKEALDLVEAVSPTQAGFTAQIVIEADQGVDDPAVRQALEPFFQEIPSLDEHGETTVSSPYDAPQQISERGEFAGTIAFAELQVSDRDFETLISYGNAVEKRGAEIDVPGLTIEYGGDMFADFEFPASEILGILAAVIILLFAFGSVLAMGLPIGTALLGLGTATAIVTIASNVIEMPDFSLQMAAMIGLGVGIDYALFIVTRYREGLHIGLDPEEAVVEAVDTSGRAVLFAGITVVIALFGLWLSGLAFVRGLATAAIVAVAVMVVGSLVLLPALLALVKHRIEVTTYRGAVGVAVVALAVLAAFITGTAAVAFFGVIALALVIVGSFTFAKGLKRHVPVRKRPPRERQIWYRWSRFIQHRPWPAAIAGVVILGLLAIPLFSIRLGFGDYGNLPEDKTPRRAYDLLADGFGAGTNGPLMIVVRGGAAGDPAQLDSLATAIGNEDDVSFVAPPQELSEGLSFLMVYPESAPQDKETTSLVNHLRKDVIPETGVDALVGGFTAAGVDFSRYLGDRLPLMIAFVLILSFLLLMVVFRSVLVPLKAVVMNLLSIGAAYGFVVAVFQWGWGASLIGVGREGPIDAWAPMMLFAIVFGLSMDYEVFLLSRIKEEYDRTKDNGLAVADGLASTARVITAAALIMVCVFGAFVFGDDRSIKLFGLGLGVAVLIDATIVRMLLVPATMELLGDRNWWAPKWLLKILPKVNVEGHGHPTSTPTPAGDEELATADD